MLISMTMQYEITPFEFGAWQGDFGSFTPTEWLGTQMKGGFPANKSSCVRGFDKTRYAHGFSLNNSKNYAEFVVSLVS
jgi:hypothetical protein